MKCWKYYQKCRKYKVLEVPELNQDNPEDKQSKMTRLLKHADGWSEESVNDEHRLPLIEGETRWELDATHPYFEHGIDESM